MGIIKTSLKEKVGYGFGDMSSSMFWKIFSYYLPFFYSNIFGLRLDQVALLLIITRIWDAVSDPMMGILADRTSTRWGKYRPYLLLIAVPFALSGIFLFSTPAAGPTLKLFWAYLTYILMMTVYTGINVPYGAMLGVMTDDSDTKTVLSSFRMFFAYGGSFIALFCWEPLCRVLGGYDTPAGWQHAMIVIAAACLVMFLLCFGMTREKLHTESTVSVGSDLKSLLRNAPWWILIGAALCSNLFNTVRGSTVAYFFNDVIGENVHLNLGGWGFLFYAGLFLSIGEVCNMAGVALAVPIAAKLGKKTTYMTSFIALIALSIIFFYIPVSQSGYWWMLVLQVIISIFTGIISPLVWSMYADVSDFAENRDGTASTGLIFSSASMATIRQARTYRRRSAGETGGSRGSHRTGLEGPAERNALHPGHPRTHPCRRIGFRLCDRPAGSSFLTAWTITVISMTGPGNSSSPGPTRRGRGSITSEPTISFP